MIRQNTNIRVERERERENVYNNNSKIYVFDLARGIASFLLVVSHYLFHSHNKTPLLTSVSGTAIFYFISGFVIYMSFERNSLKQWLIKRFFRLYPTILFITFTSLFIVYLKGETTLQKVNIDVKNIITNLTFLFHFLPHNNNTLQDHLYIATTWTICVDFTFYIFLILTYKVCKTPKGRINLIVFFTLFCLVVITILKKSITFMAQCFKHFNAYYHFILE